jgi:predicted XRE-type DNA-binding protein
MRYRCRLISMQDDDEGPDFLDELIAESTARNPDFPLLMEQARRKRELLMALKAARRQSKVSQKDVASAMGTTQSAVSELESISADAKISTVERYARAVGYSVQFHLLPADQAADEPAVVVHARR